MNAPTKSDLQHISHIQSEFDELVDQAYRGGIKEHGGHLWEKPVAREALAEAVDQVVYLITLRDQIDEACKIAHDGLNSDDDARTACFHVLQTLGRTAEMPELPRKTRQQLERERDYWKELARR